MLLVNTLLSTTLDTCTILIPKTAATAVLVQKAVEFSVKVGFKMENSLGPQKCLEQKLTNGFFMKVQIYQIIFGKLLKPTHLIDRSWRLPETTTLNFTFKVNTEEIFSQLVSQDNAVYLTNAQEVYVQSLGKILSSRLEQTSKVRWKTPLHDDIKFIITSWYEMK